MSVERDVLQELLYVVRRLRDPISGCAWDLQQDFRSIAPFTIEEAYEVADAIERNDTGDLQDELGDLLFRVVFQSQLASEADWFTFNDVAKGIVEKMIRRHPHVFGQAVYANEAELEAAWETIKTEERATKQGRTQTGTLALHPSALDGIARNLPALKRADKVQKRAARVGFDWPDIRPVWDKIDEELIELKEALAQGDHVAVEEELGDVLFTVVNLARHCSVDAESALQRASGKFDGRFRCVETLAADQNRTLDAMDLNELDRLWREAKKVL